MKKCIIIGSGLGGLSSGCILAKNGYDVTILEQGNQIGGCLQCFKRGDSIFDTGMHYIGSADKGQTLYAMFKYLGILSEVKLQKLDTNGYDIISYMGKHYRLATGREDFVKALSEKFPDSKEELYKYYDTIKLVASSSAIHSLNENVDLNIHAEYQLKSVNDVIDSLITNPILRQVLTGVLPLYAGERDKTPFTTHALIMDFYLESAYRIIGGSSIVADALAAQISKLNGRILTNKKVVKIETDDRHATGVFTEDGNCFKADLIISSIHPACTMELTSSKLLRTAYRKRIKEFHNTTSAFVVYLKFRENMVQYMNHNLYYYRSESTWGCEKYDGQSWPKSILYMHFCHKENPEYADSGEIITYMDYNEMKPWFGTHIGNRGEDYKQFKRKKAETIIDALEVEIPGLRNCIECYYTSTPLTYRDYTGVPEGAMYGVAKNVNVIGLGTVSSRTRIPNLFLTGQSITSHGMMGVLAGSFITCSEILTTEVLFPQLKKSLE